MAPQLSDTDPAAERVQIELLRNASTWRRVAMLGEMWETVRALALSGLRDRYPDASPEELQRRLADVLLGPELAGRAYGPIGRGEHH